VRQSIAAGVNITYKILYNDAVAMTGGQQIGERPEGHSVVQIAQSMRAEGAQSIVVVTDEPEKYASAKGLPEGVHVQHRDELDRIQRELREIKGTTVIIYDQTCATEKRRRRKRGTLVDPAVRVVINELVCEGCGDCGVQSNCISVEPLETEFGRKRQINQSTCNKDVSCVKGFCPSFVTVEGGSLRKRKAPTLAAPGQPEDIPAPQIVDLVNAVDGVWGVVVAGVGGTGVITIGQLLGVAAHMEGKGIVTQDAGGLAQKGGATWSHVLISHTQDAIRTTRVGMACADLVIGCDPIVTAGKETSMRLRAGRSHVVMNSHSAPTAAFVKNANWSNPGEACIAQVAGILQDPAALGCVDAEGIARQLLGDSIFTNPVMLGYAWQKGWIPLAQASLLRAMELNAVAVEKNHAAFQWGRRAAYDPDGVARALQPGQTIAFLNAPQERASMLDAFILRRATFLTHYQNAAYARRYTDFVARVRQTELAALGTKAKDLPLSFAVARYLFKLMAYKDEYEVARLHSDPAFNQKIGAMFEGDYQVHYHLAPPLLAKRNERGELQKRKFGPAIAWGFRLLAPLKVLRGTVLDPFGASDERRQERALIGSYQNTLATYLEKLDSTNAADALAFAKLPEQIRGFGHVKARHIAAVRGQWVGLRGQL
jgi:indolepyruvate ferredoxin oxidoreductase